MGSALADLVFLAVSYNWNLKKKKLLLASSFLMCYKSFLTSSQGLLLKTVKVLLGSINKDLQSFWKISFALKNKRSWLRLAMPSPSVFSSNMYPAFSISFNTMYCRRGITNFSKKKKKHWFSKVNRDNCGHCIIVLRIFGYHCKKRQQNPWLESSLSIRLTFFPSSNDIISSSRSCKIKIGQYTSANLKIT